MPNHRLLACIDNLEKVEKVVVLDGVEILDHKKFISWDEFISLGSKIEENEVLNKTDAIFPPAGVLTSTLPLRDSSFPVTVTTSSILKSSAAVMPDTPRLIIITARL